MCRPRVKRAIAWAAVPLRLRGRKPTPMLAACFAIGKNQPEPGIGTAVKLSSNVGQQVHLIEDAQCARCESIATSLVAREIGAVQQQDVESAATQEVRRGRASWPGPDDDDVMRVHHARG